MGKADAAATGRPAAGERDVVRELARRVAEIAASEDNRAIHRRWCDVNALRKPDRAPVWCRPVGCWKEILPPESLACRDPWLREVEHGLRQALHKHDIGDDSPVEPYFAVEAVFDVDPPNIWGVEVRRQDSGVEGGSWKYDPPLKTQADFDRLAAPAWTFNQAETDRRLQRAQELLGGVLPVKLTCGPAFDSASVQGPAADLRGLGQLLMDMALEPGLVHRLMAYVQRARMRQLDAWEATGLLTPNNRGAMICSDPVGPPPVGGRHTLGNCWCAGNSQEFDPVSPAMWEEFLLAYQKPIFARFGLACYGCCENLTRKIDGVLSIPNLRIFVCSAWTDLDAVLEKVPGDCVIMWRQKASDVVFPDDEAAIRRDLDEGLRKLRGRRYQIVLRELQTLHGHPDRLHVWTAIAKELAARYA